MPLICPMPRPVLALYLPLTLLAACADADLTGDSTPADLSAASPDGRLAVAFTLGPDSSLTYALTRDGEPVVEPSRLGFTERDWGEVTAGFVVVSAETSTGRETYDLPWGEVASVDAGFGESLLTVEHPASGARFTVTARLFDDGLGIRYAFPAQAGRDSLHILEEHTAVNLPGDPLVQWGPGDWNSYENPVELTRRSEIDALKYDARDQLISRVVPHNAVMTPATARLQNGTHVALHEAALIDYPEMTLAVTETGFETILAGTERRRAKAVRALPFETPWRTAQVEDRAVDLLANVLTLNLNPPNELGDVSWFTPMTYAGVWWEMHLGVGTWDYAGGQSTNTMMDVGTTGRESRHAARTDNVKRYIDFCADNDIGGLLVEGWNTGWEVWLDPEEREDVFDFVTPYPDYDLEEVVAYGKTKGVQIVMHHETSASVPQYERQQDTAYALMQRLGIHSVKTGYVGNIIPDGEYHHGQYMVRHFRDTYRKAAEYEVAVNPHEPIKQTGERRTLPNAISAEAAKGMEYNSNGQRPGGPGQGVNPLAHLPSLVYTRCLAGPFDYTPGIFRLDLSDYRGPGTGLASTLGKQLGTYVVVMSPIQMLADLPEHYRVEDAGAVEVSYNGEPVADAADLPVEVQRALRQNGYHPAMAFLREMATTWDATYPLAGELGDYAVVARKARGEDRYFVGGIAGEEARTVKLDFAFLPEGRSYELTVYADAADAHYWDNRDALDIRRRFVSRGDEVEVAMVAGGGFGAVLEYGVPE